MNLDEDIKRYLPQYLSDTDLGQLKEELAKFTEYGTKDTIYTIALNGANIITLKAVISTSLFLGGMVFTTPTLGAEIDDYSSLQQTSGKPAEEQNNIVLPSISIDCNADTKITPVEQSDADILVSFAKSILDGTKSLDADISKLVDENFWDLV